MQPIINPWIIYLIGFITKLDGLVIILAIVFAILAFMYGGLYLNELTLYTDENDLIRYKKSCKSCFLWFGIAAFILILIPSRETMYTMFILKNITPDNISTAGESIDQTVDNIISKIDKLLDDDES